MAPIDLANYDLAELKGLLFDIDREIKRRKQDERDAARDRIAALAGSLGMSVDDVLRTGRSGARRKRG